MRVAASQARDPQRWCAVFDQEVQCELFTNVTGSPWSLLEYVLRRLRFRPEDSDLEHVLHMFCALHVAHREGPSARWKEGMLIGQFFKATEQRLRDRDWLLAWTMTGLPEPRPRQQFQRGLAHPAEYAAGIARVQEM